MVRKFCAGGRWFRNFESKKQKRICKNATKNSFSQLLGGILGENIIAIAKEEKDLGVVVQDNLSPDKHINRIFGDIFKILRNIWVAFHFLDKDMMRKIITTMVRPKLE